MLDWRLLFIAAMGALIWLLHSQIGSYAPLLPRADHPGHERLQVAVLWGIAAAFPVLRIFYLAPALEAAIPNPTLRELVMLPLVTLVYVLPPAYLELHRNHRPACELGLTWRVWSRPAAMFALLYGLGIGLVGYASGQVVIGMQPLPAGVYLLLLYNNDFIEEFYHRGVILTKLERAAGRSRAVLLGGVLFGLTHLVLDITTLGANGVWFVIAALTLQVMAGWLLGIIFQKTRSLWPGVACHFLGNWLPSILAWLTY